MTVSQHIILKIFHYMNVKYTFLLIENCTSFENFSPLKIFILKIISPTSEYLEHISFFSKLVLFRENHPFNFIQKYF